ncbi:hypothetical protein LCGC14_2369660 [marine sediment metagenome]|uniref:Uncharacterized protein n=1 Tax=marine sediment metagenome TaxID=412755 RepID=A0A0F9C496_9ZZZZ
MVEKDVELDSSSEKQKLGPKVLSNIGLEDKDYMIANGEIKNLPADYESRPQIVQCIKQGRLKILETEEDNKETSRDITLDDKDISNFLNQNTRTVIKQLRINELSQKDLTKLLVAETKSKRRKDIIKFIKTLKEVI